MPGWPEGIRERKAVQKALLGAAGEELAARYLTEHGLRIIARNWRSGRDEIDIICEEETEGPVRIPGEKTLVFVEVKTRTSEDLERASSALDRRKCRAQLRAARRWLDEKDAWHLPCRFDLICISGEERRVEHIRNVIDAGFSYTGGYSSWQPW